MALVTLVGLFICVGSHMALDVACLGEPPSTLFALKRLVAGVSADVVGKDSRADKHFVAGCAFVAFRSRVGEHVLFEGGLTLARPFAIESWTLLDRAIKILDDTRMRE